MFKGFFRYQSVFEWLDKVKENYVSRSLKWFIRKWNQLLHKILILIKTFLINFDVLLQKMLIFYALYDLQVINKKNHLS